MEKITLRMFFERLFSKLTNCLISKNKITALRFFKFKNNTCINSGNELGGVKRRLFHYPAIIFLLGLFFTTTVIAQSSPADCKTGCTSNDVQIVRAYLVDINDVELSSSFSCQGTTEVKLALDLTTKTPRKGVVIYANINDFTGGVITTSPLLVNVKECFSSALNLPTNKVVFSNKFGWTCGTPIVLTDVFIGWGTGNTDFCTANSNFRCPATSSKCYQLPPGDYITVQIPTAAPASATKCSTVPSGTTAVFNLTTLESTVKGSQTNVNVSWYTDEALSYEITNPGSYNSATGNVYAKVSSTLAPYPFSKSTVMLTVNSTPAAPTSGGNQTQCEQSPIQTLTATASVPAGVTITWYATESGGSAVSPTKNTTGSVIYYAQASNGTCNSLTRTPVTLTINAAPAAPTSGGNQTQCEQSPIQTLTATASVPTGVTITWYAVESGGSAVSPTKNTTGSVTYYAQASNGTCNSLTRTPVTLTINAAPAAPTSGGNQTQCEQSPIQTLTATASVPTGVTITWYAAESGGSAVSPTKNTTGSVIYYAQASNGTCNSLTRTPVTLTINAAPAAPISGGNQTQCEQSPIQTLTATASVPAGVTITWYAAESGGSAVSPTKNTTGSVIYYAQASNGTCNGLTRTPVTLTINAAPAAPTICVVQPSLCGPATGSVTILSPIGSGFNYSIDNGANWQPSTVFSNLAAGSVTGIKVKNTSTGCVSATASCINSDCSATSSPANTVSTPAKTSVDSSAKIAPTETTITAKTSTAGFDAYPVPFKDQLTVKYKFDYKSDVKIEVFNSRGISVLSKSDTNGYMNKEVTLDLKLNKEKEQVYIVKLTTDRETSTKKVLSSK